MLRAVAASEGRGTHPAGSVSSVAPEIRRGLGLVAGDIMRPGVPRLRSEMSLAHAADLMRSVGVRDLPVVEGDRLVGILTERDLQPHRGHFEWTPVRVAMTPSPDVVTPDMPVGVVAQRLLGRGFNSVPVVRDGVFLGMVARSDLLGLLADGEGQ